MFENEKYECGFSFHVWVFAHFKDFCDFGLHRFDPFSTNPIWILSFAFWIHKTSYNVVRWTEKKLLQLRLNQIIIILIECGTEWVREYDTEMEIIYYYFSSTSKKNKWAKLANKIPMHVLSVFCLFAKFRAKILFRISSFEPFCAHWKTFQINENENENIHIRLFLFWIISLRSQ